MILWMMPDGATRTQEMINNFLEPFKKANPDIPIEIRVINRRTLWAKIFTLKNSCALDESPDLIAFPHYWTELLVQSGALENLTALDKSIRVDNCLDSLKPHCYKKGTPDIYSMPWWFDISALHYREDHLKLITDNPQKLLSTWAGLLDACKALKEHFEGIEGYYPIQNSDWRGTLSNRGVLPCLWSRSAQMVHAGGINGVGEPVFEQGLSDYIELALKNYMPILRERSSIGNITSGRASMILSRRNGLSTFEMPVNTLSIPRSGANYANYLGGVNLGIIKSNRERDNALSLLKWITSAENQIKYARAAEGFPALEEELRSFISSLPPRIKNYTQIIADSQTLPGLMATGALMEVLGELLSAAATAVVSGRYTKDLLAAEIKKAKAGTDDIIRLYGEQE